MKLETQFKLKSDPNYQKYIRENSYWYKILNRMPEAFSEFEAEVKHNYRLKFTDKLGSALNTIEMLQNVLSTLK